MFESFSDFIKKRQKRRPNLPSEEEHVWNMHDEHKDAVMHHLYQLHKLTHPRADYSRVSERLKQGNKHINDLHKSVSQHIKDHGGNTD